MEPTTRETESSGDRSGASVGAGWRLGRLLGSGGMASVYAATDAEGRHAAIKLLHPEMTRRRELKERFLREAYVANRIGHPSVVKILDHADGPDVFLVLELLEGEPLSGRLQRASELSVRDLLGFADQILDALAAAHKAGVIHRDIKPDNVFVTTDGSIKILDFGIARVIDDVPSEFKTRTGLALGTIPYMAPEQALGRRGKVDGRTDLFALGALLYRALAGRRIHEEPSEAELLVAMATKPAPKLADVAPSVPGAVCAIIDRALAFSQDARYPDAETMQEDVRAVLAGRVPPFAVAAAQKADEATRIGPAAAGAASASLRDAPTVATSAPFSVRERTLESAGVIAPYPPEVTAPPSLTAPGSIAATPAAFVSDALPRSLPVASGSEPPAAALRPKKQRSLVLVLAFSFAALFVFVALAVGAVLLGPWRSLGSPAAGAATESPSIAISTAGPEAPSLPGAAESPSVPAESARASGAAPEAPAAGGTPVAPAAAAKALPATPGATAPPAATTTAPAAPATGSAKSANPPAPSPSPPAPKASAPVPAPSPAAPAVPAPSPSSPSKGKPGDDKGKGKDKDKHKSK